MCLRLPARLSILCRARTHPLERAWLAACGRGTVVAPGRADAAEEGHLAGAELSQPFYRLFTPHRERVHRRPSVPAAEEPGLSHRGSSLRGPQRGAGGQGGGAPPLPSLAKHLPAGQRGRPRPRAQGTVRGSLGLQQAGVQATVRGARAGFVQLEPGALPPPLCDPRSSGNTGVHACAGHGLCLRVSGRPGCGSWLCHPSSAV